MELGQVTYLFKAPWLFLCLVASLITANPDEKVAASPPGITACPANGRKCS